MDRRALLPALALGFALGGFFDGILLHQILQWHHLLSLVDGVGDLRAQVRWDGAFHAFHSLLALAGLWGLWRATHAGDRPAGAALLGGLLVGFGLWHVADAALSHWLLGLHRIRLDGESPLASDLGWLAAFGLVPIAAGWPLLRRRGPGAPGSAIAVLAALSIGAGLWAGRTPEGSFSVVFAPGLGPGAVLAAPEGKDARLVAGGPRQGVSGVDAPSAARWSYRRHGALLVGGAGLPPGSLSRSRAGARAGEGNG